MMCINFDKGLLNENIYDVKNIYVNETTVFLGTEKIEYSISCNTSQEAEILLSELTAFISTSLKENRHNDVFKKFSYGQLMISRY